MATPSHPSLCAKMGTPASLYCQLFTRAISCSLPLHVQKSPRISGCKSVASFESSSSLPSCSTGDTSLSFPSGNTLPLAFLLLLFSPGFSSFPELPSFPSLLSEILILQSSYSSQSLPWAYTFTPMALVTTYILGTFFSSYRIKNLL